MPRAKRAQRRADAPTHALFVRIPAEHARRLDRAAFELRKPKQALVAELLERYVDPDSSASLAALARAPAGEQAHARPLAHRSPRGDAGRRRVVVETVDDALVVGHHSFAPNEPPASVEVLTSEQAGELLQLDAATVERLASAGELPGRRLAGEWRFARAALVDWLSQPDASLASRAGGEDERGR